MDAGAKRTTAAVLGSAPQAAPRRGSVLVRAVVLVLPRLVDVLVRVRDVAVAVLVLGVGMVVRMLVAVLRGAASKEALQ
jgi:hypothetical protein